jgi:hypothetical protein
MILYFSNLETLRLALTSAAIPEATSRARARAGFDGQGAAWVEVSPPLSLTAQADLRRLGVKIEESSPVPLDFQACCWPQLLPVVPSPAARSSMEKTPVLFEIADNQMADLVNEVLRLGNDRQAFRRLTDGEASRVLLRVIGPPYYSLLRALDGVDRELSPRAYLERNPRVWVEIGFTHPLVELLQAPPGKLLFLRPPRQWTFIDEGPFRDIYEVLEFTLPAEPVRWQAAELPGRLTVPLRLSRGGSAEPAELWVLSEKGQDQLDTLVRNADNELVARLAFAVGTAEGRTRVVLRVRPSRLPPPVLVVEGVAFRPYLRLPNLFLPCDTRLHPPLRRDVVSRLLASDPQQITWLYPHADGRFTSEGLPDEAFRPLADWVDYVLDQDHQALEAWVQAARFDFEPFICRDDQPAPATKAPERGPRRPPQSKDPKDSPTEAPAPAPAVEVVEQPEPTEPEEDPLIEPSAKDKAGPLLRRLRELEERFVQLQAPLDAPPRRELWRQMAQLNTALGRAGDATLCWANAFWEEENPPPTWWEAWARAETTKAAHARPTAARLDRLLANPTPTGAELRALAAGLAWAAFGPRAAPELVARLGPIQQLLEKHESFLPVRVAWLAWGALVRLAGGDVLGLARARDRLLEQLYQYGLNADLDLASFLRFSGMKAVDRFRAVRDHILRLREVIHRWLAEAKYLRPETRDYADLMFAFGLARLGQAKECQTLLGPAQEALGTLDEVHDWLQRAFTYRIGQALEGKVHSGRLPDELLAELEQMDQKKTDPHEQKRAKEMRYKIDRLRQKSLILEPQEKLEPYRRWHGHFQDALSQELGTLCDINDRAELSSRFRELLKRKRGGRGAEAVEARIVGTGLELAHRLGEEFAGDMLGRVGHVLDKLTDPLERARLLEKGLFLAAHYDQPAHVQAFVACFHQLLAAQRPDTLHRFEPVLDQCFRGLRKLGLRDEIGKLLDRLVEAILQAQKVTDVQLIKLQNIPAGMATENWNNTLILLLQTAGGWFYMGQEDRARHILDEVREVLFKGDLIESHQTTLACAYVRTLGQAPTELAIGRLEQLFRRMDRIRDMYTTNTHYSLARLCLVEAVVLALVSDDFTLDPASRRWLEDDEFLVRRRIHRDVRAGVSLAGLA